MSVFQLLYASGATAAVTDADIAAILDVSRANNARLGVTGMLLYANRTFIQVLEGQEAVVRKLASTISRDPRHRNYMELVVRNAPGRVFGEWQMGFKQLLTERKDDERIFRTTRTALESRVGLGDDGMLLDTILAFTGRDFLAA